MQELEQVVARSKRKFKHLSQSDVRSQTASHVSVLLTFDRFETNRIDFMLNTLLILNPGEDVLDTPVCKE